MKKIAVLLLSVMLAVVSYGQSNDDQSREVYAFVKVFKFANDKITATIDLGNGTPRMVFADDKEKTRKFKSDFEPINLLIKNGWKIENFSPWVNPTNTLSITHWVMKKKVNEESEVKEGMILIEE